MKLLRLPLLRLALFTASTAAFAQTYTTYTPSRVISVSGSAEIKVSPDIVFLQLGVESRNPELALARSDNDRRVAGALAYLRNQSIPSEDVKTNFVGVEPRYDNEDPVPRYYSVRKSIEVRLTDLSRFEELLSALLDRGVTHIHSVRYHTSAFRQLRDEARAKAALAAREKAVALCAELGVTCGAVQSINASDNSGWSGGGGHWGAGIGIVMGNFSGSSGSLTDDESETLSIGQISVSAQVNLSFALE